MGKTQNKSVLIGIAVALVAVVSLAVILLNNDTKAPEEPSTVLIIDEAGTFDVGTDYEEVIINVPDVTIQNGSVNKIFVADTVGDGDVTLLNVTSNELELEGGGPNSITIAGTSNIKAIRVERTDGGIRVVVTDSSSVETVTVYKGSQDVTLEGKFDNLAIDASNINISVKNATMGTLSVSGEGTSITVDEKSTITTANFLPTATKTTFTLNGSVEKLVVESKESAIEVNGKVTAVDIKKDAEKASITINEGAEVASLATSTEVSVNGTGTLKEVTADDESNLVGTIKPGKVTVLNEPAKEPEAPKPTTPTPTTKPAEPSKPKPAEPQKPVDPPKKDILVSKITITGGNKVVNGSTLQLTATVSPANATNKTVTWTSSNEAVATVDANGKVTAVAKGTATITAKAGDKTATVAVTVEVAEEPVVVVSAISVDQTTLTLTAGGATATITATVLPADATNKTVTWTSSDESVATVTNGVVTPVTMGAVTITASTVDGGKTATASVVVFGEKDVLNATQVKEYDTIQAAIDAAEDGDTIQIAAGTYGESIVVPEEKVRSITILGADSATIPTSSDVDGTIITGGMTFGRDISTNPTIEKSITVKGITFSGGSGLIFKDIRNVTVENNKFIGITAGDAAVTVLDPSPNDRAGVTTISNNYIDGVSGLGIYVRRPAPTTVIEGNHVEDTDHNSIQVVGVSAGPDVTITGNTLINWDQNEDADGGRAIRINFDPVDASTTLAVTGNTFHPNGDADPVDPDYVKITGVSTANNNVNNLISSLIDDNTWPSGTDYGTVILVNTTAGTNMAASITSESTTNYYPTIQAAIDAATSGDAIVLGSNTTVAETVRITSGQSITLDLNGYTIDTSTVVYVPGLCTGVITVDGGNLTIEGPGIVDGREHDDYAVEVRGGGTVTINGGTFKGSATAIQANVGTVHVNGGSFEATPVDTAAYGENGHQFTLNCIDANYTNGTAIIEVTGGTFYRFNPGDNLSEGPFTNYLAPGYQATAEGDNYVVSETPAIDTESELQAAVANGGTVTLGGNITLSSALIVDQTVTLDLNGYTIDTSNGVYVPGECTAVITVDGGNLTIEGPGTVDGSGYDDYAVEVRGDGMVTINGGTFRGSATAVQANVGTVHVNGGSFEATPVDTAAYGENGHQFTLNCIDANYTNGTAIIEVTGGTFYRFNPGDNLSEGPLTNYLPHGYQATVSGDNYVVSF